MHKQTSQELLLVCASRLELPTYFHFNVRFPLVTHFVCTSPWRPPATTTLSFFIHLGVWSLFKLWPVESKGCSTGADPLTSRERKIFLIWGSYKEALRIIKEEAILKEAQATVQMRNPPKKRIQWSDSVRPSGWPSMMLPWPTIPPCGARRKLFLAFKAPNATRSQLFQKQHYSSQ